MNDRIEYKEIHDSEGPNYWEAIVQRDLNIAYKCVHCGEQNTTLASIEKRVKVRNHRFFNPKLKDYLESNQKAELSTSEIKEIELTEELGKSMLNRAEGDIRLSVEEGLQKHRVKINPICKHCNASQSWAKTVNKRIMIQRGRGCCLALIIIIIFPVVLSVVLSVVPFRILNFSKLSVVLVFGISLLIAYFISKLIVYFISKLLHISYDELINKLFSRLGLPSRSHTQESIDRSTDSEYKPYVVTKDSNKEDTSTPSG